MVLSGKLSATSGLVNIISYDLAVKMAEEVKVKRFRAVIVVRRRRRRAVDLVVLMIDL